MFNLFEVASISTKKTGLPLKIYVSAKGKTKHGPRIKVSSLYGDRIHPDRLFTITISENPKVIGDTAGIKVEDIQEIVEFVVDNTGILLAHWNEEIDTDDLFDSLIYFKRS